MTYDNGSSNNTFSDNISNITRDCMNVTRNNNTATHFVEYGTKPRIIESSDKHTFWLRYTSLVYDADLEHKNDTENKNAQRPFAISEAPTTVMPFMAYLELLFTDEPDEPYNDGFLYNLVHYYQESLRELFVVDNEDLNCVVLSSVSFWKEPTTKRRGWSLLLHFPTCVIDNMYVHRVHEKVITNISRINLLGSLPHTPIGSWDTIINTSYHTHPVPMYGSVSRSYHTRMEVTDVLAYISYNENQDKINPPIQLEIGAFNPSDHSDVTQNLLPEDDDYFNHNDDNYYYPIILSIRFCQRVSLPIVPQHTPNKTTKEYFEACNDDETLLTTLLDMLDQDRAVDDRFWRDIGGAICNSTKDSKIGIGIWKRWSQKCGRNPADCDKPYEEMVDGRRSVYTTVKTIAWFAMKDNPDSYKEWHDLWVSQAIEGTARKTPGSVAKAFYRFYWLEFLYENIEKGGRWYRYQNHHWCQVRNGLFLDQVLMGEFRDLFVECKDRLLLSPQGANDPAVAAINRLKAEAFSKVADKLEDPGFIGGVKKLSKSYFCHNNFTVVSDLDPTVTGVKNGVLEVIGDNIRFRPGKPEDFLIKCAPVMYRMDYSYNTPIVKEFMLWVKQMFQDVPTKEYWLKYRSSMLYGVNRDKKFHAMWGKTNNAKTTLSELAQSTMGPYIVKLPITALTRKMGDAGGVSPHLARTQKTREVILDEPDDDDALKKSLFKILTGNEKFFARFLQDQGDEIKAVYKATLNGNVIPPMDNPDDASEDRFVVVPMLTQYSNKAPTSVAEQWKQSHFPVDKDFIDKVSNFSTAFLWVMVSYFPKYMEEGLVKTELINQYTMEYWKENNLFSTFLKMCVNYVGRTSDGKLIETAESALKGKEAEGSAPCQFTAHKALADKFSNLPKMPTMKLFTTFSTWYRVYFPGGQKAPNIKAFISNLSRIIGPPIGNVWPGLVLVKADNGTKGQEQVTPASENKSLIPNIGISKVNALKNLKKKTTTVNESKKTDDGESSRKSKTRSSQGRKSATVISGIDISGVDIEADGSATPERRSSQRISATRT